MTTEKNPIECRALFSPRLILIIASKKLHTCLTRTIRVSMQLMRPDMSFCLFPFDSPSARHVIVKERS